MEWTAGPELRVNDKHIRTVRKDGSGLLWLVVGDLDAAFGHLGPERYCLFDSDCETLPDGTRVLPPNCIDSIVAPVPLEHLSEGAGVDAEQASLLFAGAPNGRTIPGEAGVETTAKQEWVSTCFFAPDGTPYWYDYDVELMLDVPDDVAAIDLECRVRAEAAARRIDVSEVFLTPPYQHDDIDEFYARPKRYSARAISLAVASCPAVDEAVLDAFSLFQWVAVPPRRQRPVGARDWARKTRHLESYRDARPHDSIRLHEVLDAFGSAGRSHPMLAIDLASTMVREQGADPIGIHVYDRSTVNLTSAWYLAAAIGELDRDEHLLW
ncbi:MAG: hypothetical protein E6640_01785 [Actinomyces urogenitalis]|uniref:hypothetical protein n=1 Tax=Actinomyces urogenitalis TaxID=103621 RepID=UPI002914AD6D|nr:hypothetical protein [Actinomyces urogenitalis]MDU6150942.1 hypothetical protein [Actinomyces urogenitalis]